jgi:hypothetical protein
MSIAVKLQLAKGNPKLFTVRGDLSMEPDGRVRITFTKDAYAIVKEPDIHPEFILPLSRGEDPSGRNSKFAVKLTDGADVELHVDTLVHPFKIGQGQRAFYIDEQELTVVYIDTLKKSYCAYKCKKYVNVADIYCCGNGFTHSGFGYVGCSDDWCDEDRCCPDLAARHYGCKCRHS